MTPRSAGALAVTRERAQSFLTEEHISKIVDAYRNFDDRAGFSRVVSTDRVRDHHFNLSIPLYARADQTPKIAESPSSYGEEPLKESINQRLESSDALRKSMNELLETLNTFSDVTAEKRVDDDTNQSEPVPRKEG